MDFEEVTISCLCKLTVLFLFQLTIAYMKLVCSGTKQLVPTANINCRGVGIYIVWKQIPVIM